MSYTNAIECDDQNTALSIAKKVIKKDVDGNTCIATRGLETDEE